MSGVASIGRRWKLQAPIAQRSTTAARMAQRNWIAAAMKRSRSAGDRKSDVSGKSVSVRVDLGGRRIIRKKNRLSCTPITSSVRLTHQHYTQYAHNHHIPI